MIAPHQHHGHSRQAIETADQLAAEAIAERLLRSPAMLAAIAACRRSLAEDAAAAGVDGRATLDAALGHLAFAAALGGAAGDASRPQIIWTLAAPRIGVAGSVSGSKYLIDNPDNVYRFVTLDGVSSYEIAVSSRAPGPAQFNFMLHDTMFSEDSKKDLADLDQPISGLRDIDIVRDDDGSFVITIDPRPADGRVNHIRSNGDARLMWIRNSLNDWGVQNPQRMTITRTGGPPAPPPRDEPAMADHAAAILRGGTQWLLALMNRTFGHVVEPNTLSRPFGRGGAWGYAARANFRLAPDQAIVIALAPPLPGSYLGLQLTDPWQVSLEYVERSGSLNDRQADADADGDGGYHVVLASRDPGVKNWLDTSGLHEGGLLIRWQRLADASTDSAVRGFRLVALDDLAGYLPPGTRILSPDERAALNRERAQLYAHRYRGIVA